MENFHEQATAWRALATKPALPEGLKAYFVLAEQAIKNHEPEEALNDYELGVESYPMWPGGWYNAALAAGDLGYYADAAEEMQNYLELTPNAPDAQTARAYMEGWKIKAGK